MSSYEMIKVFAARSVALSVYFDGRNGRKAYKNTGFILHPCPDKKQSPYLNIAKVKFKRD
jgi:hypothetical protein